MKCKWIDKVVEHGSYGDSGVLVVAPHEGVELMEVEAGGRRHLVRLGERGSGYLARLAAKQVGGSYIIVHVPRTHADFARDPALLGKGERFRLHIDGEWKVWLDCHTDELYAGVLEKFHDLIEDIDPQFLLDYHTMGNRNIDIKLGFGEERRYIGGTEKALMFRDEVTSRMEHSVKMLVSKLELTGESEFILNSHQSGRNAALVEFSSTRGFRLSRGHIKPAFVEAAKKVAEVAGGWPPR